MGQNRPKQWLSPGRLSILKFTFFVLKNSSELKNFLKNSLEIATLKFDRLKLACMVKKMTKVFAILLENKVARFFLTQYTKTGEYIPNYR
jgi:hypothetical protein